MLYYPLEIKMIMVDTLSKRVSHDLEENPKISLRRDHILRGRYVDKGRCKKRTFVIAIMMQEHPALHPSPNLMFRSDLEGFFIF